MPACAFRRFLPCPQEHTAVTMEVPGKARLAAAFQKLVGDYVATKYPRKLPAAAR